MILYASSSGAPRGGSDDRAQGSSARPRPRRRAPSGPRATVAAAGLRASSRADRDPHPRPRLSGPAAVRDARVLDPRRLRQPARLRLVIAAILSDPNLVDGIIDVARDRRADGPRDARSCSCRPWSGPSSGSRACGGWSSSCACCRSPSRRSCIVVGHRARSTSGWASTSGARRRVAAHARLHRHHPGPAVRVPRHRRRPALDRRRARSPTRRAAWAPAGRGRSSR